MDKYKQMEEKEKKEKRKKENEKRGERKIKGTSGFKLNVRKKKT
jgi:hypothetical protein